MTDPTTPEDRDGCGYSYEHYLIEIDTRDGLTTFECRRCGAEIIAEDAGGWE